MGTTTALLGGGLIAAAGPAAADEGSFVVGECELGVVAWADFSDDSMGEGLVASAPAVAEIVTEPGQPLNTVLQINAAADHNGLRTAPGVLQEGASYAVTARARMAPEAPGANAQWQQSAPSWGPWIGRTALGQSWHTFSVTYGPAPAGAQLSLQGPVGAFLVDDVVVTRTAVPVSCIAVDPGPDPEPIPDPEPTESIVFDFEDGQGEWLPRVIQDPRDPRHGSLVPPVLWENPPFPATDIPALTLVEGNGGGYALAVTERNAAIRGAQVDLIGAITPGDTVEFSADIRLLNEGETAQVRLGREHAFGNPPIRQTHTQAGPWEVTDEWTTVTGTVPSWVSPQIYKWLFFDTVAGTADFAIDNVRFDVVERNRPYAPPLQDFMDGIALGVAIDANEVVGYDADLVTRHFNQITAENHMKPEAFFHISDIYNIAPGGQSPHFPHPGGLRPDAYQHTWDFSRIAGPGRATERGIEWDNGFRLHPQLIDLMDFAQENDIDVAGHVLAWHSQAPAFWFQVDPANPDPAYRSNALMVTAQGVVNPRIGTRDAARELMLERLENHFYNVSYAITQYWGLYGSESNPMVSWEVVNEVVAGNWGAGGRHNLETSVAGTAGPGPQLRRPDGGTWEGTVYMRNTHFSRIIGGDWTHWAMYFANNFKNGQFHANAEWTLENPSMPGAEGRITLWNNDYNTELVGAKLDVLIDLSENQVRNGVPLDGMAHQFHVNINEPPHDQWRALELTRVMNDRLREDGYWTLLTAITEWDVTGFGLANNNDNALQARLDAQGWYHYEAFNYFRRWNEENPGYLTSITIWGLQDQRSWVGPPPGAGLPTLFSGEREAKPAFWGAAGNPGAWPENADLGWYRLPRQIQQNNVFGGAPLPGDAAFGSADWGSTNPLGLGNAGNVILRHAATAPALAGYLVAFATLTDDVASLDVEYQFAGAPRITVGRDGTVTGGAIAEVLEGENGWYAIVHIPHARTAAAATPDLEITGRDAAGAVVGYLGQHHRMQLTFQVAFNTGYAVQTLAPPALGNTEARDAAWDDAVWMETGIRQQGGAPAGAGARAEFALLWGEGTQYARDGGGLVSSDTLFVRAEVTDPEIIVSAADAHNRDSVELFLDLGNAKNGSYRAFEDVQFRFEATPTSWAREYAPSTVFGDNEATPDAFTHGGGDGNRQRARLHQLHVWHTDTGYVVEAEIGLWYFNDHPTVDNRHSAESAFHGFDLQVNDAMAPQNTRQAVWSWSNPNTTGWNTTINWGVIQQVGAPVEEPIEEFGQDTVGVRRNHQILASNTIPAGAVDVNFGFGAAGDAVILGDWDGDGVDTPVIRRGSQFLGRNSNTTGNAEFVFTLPLEPGDTVLAGDWDGDGVDTLAIRRGDQVIIDGESFTFGEAGGEVFVGDWDGDGVDTLATRTGNRFSFANENVTGADLVERYFGVAGDEVLVGDFDADGRDSIAIRRTTQFLVANELGGPVEARFFFGVATDTALAGNFNGQ